jgi:hypothetical protein
VTAAGQDQGRCIPAFPRKRPAQLRTGSPTCGLARYPGSVIVHNVITSAAAVEIIREHGGTPVRSRVGHSYMKALMADHDAASRVARSMPITSRGTCGSIAKA